METLTIVINAAPYGDERLYNALRLARALVSAAIGVKVNVFLLGDAVVAAKKGQKTPEGYPNFEEILWELKKAQRLWHAAPVPAQGGLPTKT